ncbi:MAG TPA: SDR family oxidoreductase, partial [Cellulomonadaceae bacterium]|nr:SDR family oxidoreductase [Cellulomonadaceae bacterium]
MGALVLDLTGMRTVTELEYVRGVLRPAIRSLERSGRIIFVARTPETHDELEPRVLAQGLDGLNRTVAKELRGGATSNLVWVDPETSPEALASTLRFLLEGRSAYVDGQSWRVGVAQVDEDVARTTRPYDGKIVAITGAARGIGAAIARTFARDGATVVGVDVPASGEALAKVVNEIHGTALQLDITLPDAGERIAAHVAERYGADARLYAIIHNAGITRDRMLVNLDEKGWAA